MDLNVNSMSGSIAELQRFADAITNSVKDSDRPFIPFIDSTFSFYYHSSKAFFIQAAAAKVCR